MQHDVEGSRPRDRPKKTWTEIVQKDCQARGLNREDAMDHIRWKKQIRDDWWPRQVWVGECFFWYRLTRVVPDKIQRAVKWLCVCVCATIDVWTEFCWTLAASGAASGEVMHASRQKHHREVYIAAASCSHCRWWSADCEPQGNKRDNISAHIRVYCVSVNDTADVCIPGGRNISWHWLLWINGRQCTHAESEICLTHLG